MEMLKTNTLRRWSPSDSVVKIQEISGGPYAQVNKNLPQNTDSLLKLW